MYDHLNHYNDLSNITKINRDLINYNGPCTAGTSITEKKKAYATHTTYSISVISSAGSGAFDFGTVYKNNAGYICYIPSTTQPIINLRISVVYI